jgi:hypothetical protein
MLSPAQLRGCWRICWPLCNSGVPQVTWRGSSQYLPDPRQRPWNEPSSERISFGVRASTYYMQSAVMAGLKVVPVKSLQDGNLDLVDLKEKAEKHKDNLAALMVRTNGILVPTD